MSELIFSKQRHYVLISSPLSHSRKECGTNPREQNNADVFANRISWRNVKITSLTSVTSVSATNVCHERKKSLISELEKGLHAGPTWARNILTNVSPKPTQLEKPGPTYNYVPKSRASLVGVKTLCNKYPFVYVCLTRYQMPIIYIFDFQNTTCSKTPLLRSTHGSAVVIPTWLLLLSQTVPTRTILMLLFHGTT